MENLIPALIIIGSIVYKIYSEYQKEQEKARHRKIGQPPVPAPVQQHVPASPLPELPKQQKPTPLKKKPVYQEVIPEEVNRMRLTKKEPKKAISNIQKSENSNKPTFDLREAVIQSAILNRPYQ